MINVLRDERERKNKFKQSCILVIYKNYGGFRQDSLYFQEEKQISSYFFYSQEQVGNSKSWVILKDKKVVRKSSISC